MVEKMVELLDVQRVGWMDNQLAVPKVLLWGLNWVASKDKMRAEL